MTSTSRGRRTGRELIVGVLLCPDFPLLSLAGLVEALRHAADRGDNSRRLRCDWSILGQRPGVNVRASCGIDIATDAVYPDPAELDYVVVIGGLLRSLAQVPATHRKFLRDCAQAAVPVAGICTGIFVLAQENLLHRRRVCVHDYHLEDLRTLFPACQPVTGTDFVDDGSVLTCVGGTAVISLATHLIARHCGQDRAIKVVHQMTTTRRAVPSVTDQLRSMEAPTELPAVTDARVQRAIVFMEKNLLSTNVTSLAAQHVGLSVRQLERLFREQLGATPVAYNRLMRLRYAHWQLENTRHSITAIGLAAGFSDCAHFVRNFTQHFGVSPGRLRKARRPAPELSQGV